VGGVRDCLNWSRGDSLPPRAASHVQRDGDGEEGTARRVLV